MVELCKVVDVPVVKVDELLEEISCLVDLHVEPHVTSIAILLKV